MVSCIQLGTPPVSPSGAGEFRLAPLRFAAKLSGPGIEGCHFQLYRGSSVDSWGIHGVPSGFMGSLQVSLTSCGSHKHLTS